MCVFRQIENCLTVERVHDVQKFSGFGMRMSDMMCVSGQIDFIGEIEIWCGCAEMDSEFEGLNMCKSFQAPGGD